jgi:hypothetical protein
MPASTEAGAASVRSVLALVFGLLALPLACCLGGGIVPGLAAIALGWGERHPLGRAGFALGWIGLVLGLLILAATVIFFIACCAGRLPPTGCVIR